MILLIKQAYTYINNIFEGGVFMQLKTFVIKKKSGIIYHFYFSEKGGICYKIYAMRGNQKIVPFEVSITDEKILEFSVTVDEEDTIHILCLTENGDLKYFIDKEKTWDSKILSHFDLDANMVKSLFIYVYKQHLYIIYAVSNVMNINLWTIYFKYWNGSKWNNLTVGMTMCDKELPPYWVTLDPSKNLHIVYKNTGNRTTQIFYRKFHTQFSLWSTPEKIISSPETIGFYSLLCDNRGNCHLIWVCTNSSKYKMMYKLLNTKIINSKHYEKILTLDMSLHAYLQPVILEIDKTIWAMWKKEDAFWGCTIDGSGLSCSKAISIQYPPKTSPKLVIFTNHYQPEKQNFNALLLYGVIGDFVEFILPQCYANDFYENIPITDMTIEAPKPLPIKKEHASMTTPKYKTATTVPKYTETVFPPTLAQKFEELKSDNQKTADMVRELKEVVNQNLVIEFLKELKSQNTILVKLISQVLEKQTCYSENETSTKKLWEKLFKK